VVFYGMLLSRSFGNKSSKDMAFPHPHSRKDHYRNEEKPGRSGVVRNLFKRAINITEYRYAEDDVNPANDRRLMASFMIGAIPLVQLRVCKYKP
jgi:hypothetical protein